jgi:hypothetical protein
VPYMIVDMLFCLDYNFKQDDPLLHHTLYFYTKMFHDEKIANPELKEKFIKRMQELLKKDFVLKFYETDSTLLELLLNGILKYMALEGYCSMTSSLMVKIVSPACFGSNKNNDERNTLIKVTKTFFETHPTMFNEFMENFNKNINKVMTIYTGALTDSTNVFIL